MLEVDRIYRKTKQIEQDLGKIGAKVGDAYDREAWKQVEYRTERPASPPRGKRRSKRLEARGEYGEKKEEGEERQPTKAEKNVTPEGIGGRDKTRRQKKTATSKKTCLKS